MGPNMLFLAFNNPFIELFLFNLGPSKIHRKFSRPVQTRTGVDPIPSICAHVPRTRIQRPRRRR